MKVLIAEDDATSAIVLRKALEKLGHDAEVATDGDKALAILTADTNFQYRVVICDWMMPGMDGLELTRRLRGERKPGDPYRFIILLTARGRPEDRRTGLEAGADDFMVKPLDMGDLIPRLSIAKRMIDLEEISEAYTALYGGSRPVAAAPVAPDSAADEAAAKGILRTAVRDFEASEVHFEPGAGGYRVRARGAGGLLRDVPASDTVGAVVYLAHDAQNKSGVEKRWMPLGDGTFIFLATTAVPLIAGGSYILVRVLRDSAEVDAPAATLADLPMSDAVRERTRSLLRRSRGNGGMLLVTGKFGEAALVKSTLAALRNAVDTEDAFVLDATSVLTPKSGGTVDDETAAMRLRPDYLFARPNRGAGVAVLLHSSLMHSTFVIASVMRGQLSLIENRFNNIEYGYVPAASRRAMFILSVAPLAADGSKENDRYELAGADELFAQAR